MLGGTSIKYLGERRFFEVICYSNKPLKNKDSLSIETLGKSKTSKSIDVHNRNMDGHGKNYFDIRINSHEMINEYSTVSYICKNNENSLKETIITTYDFKSNTNLGTKKSGFFKNNLFLISCSSTLLLILICLKLILPMYKIIKEKTKKREQDICMNATNFFLNYDLTENLSITFDSYAKTERKEFDKQCIFTEGDVRITYVLIKFPDQTNSIYLINNLTLDASVSFWKFAYSKNIELIVTLASSFNYTNAKNSNDHFYEYAPGYFPEFIFDMIVSMKEKQKTEFTGIYLRDFEVNKLDIGKDGRNNTITTSILQLYVANWSLNNNLPSLFYISHILNIIESLECRNLLIHGTQLGRRSDILVAIILLHKEIIRKIEDGIELNDKMIEEAILLFESITKSKKFNKFEFSLIVLSLIAHLVKKGYIQNKAFENNLREIFIKLINDNKFSNI
uniref:Tyrosine-protein phosphatase domain-containing protein n=1 Tax=Strongyloides venezuelensis TaxID=75913 RepID=A0A0K0F7R2_STRVS